MADFDFLDEKQLRRNKYSHGRVAHFNTHSRGAPLFVLHGPKGCDAPAPIPRPVEPLQESARERREAERPTRRSQSEARQRMHAARHPKDEDVYGPAAAHSASDSEDAVEDTTRRLVYVKVRACTKTHNTKDKKRTSRTHRELL